MVSLGQRYRLFLLGKSSSWTHAKVGIDEHNELKVLILAASGGDVLELRAP